MNNIVVFILASWGLTHLVVSGKILEGFRNWFIIRSSFMEKMLTCYQCTGFWSGLIISFYFTNSPFHILLMGIISSGCVSFINSIYVWINTSISKMQEKL